LAPGLCFSTCDDPMSDDVAGDDAPFPQPVIVPPDALSPKTLDALIEEVVTRDGAVHGHRDESMRQQIATVKELLNVGKVVIVFDEVDESCSIVLKENLKPRDR